MAHHEILLHALAAQIEALNRDGTIDKVSKAAAILPDTRPSYESFLRYPESKETCSVSCHLFHCRGSPYTAINDSFICRQFPELVS
jgi:hypothetical protein